MRRASEWTTDNPHDRKVAFALNRPLAREIAMKRLYAHALGGEGDTKDILSMSVTEAQAEREEKARLLSPEEAELLPPPPDKRDNRLSQNDVTFESKLFSGVIVYGKKLDHEIARYAEGWSIDRMDHVDRCILRIAAFEIYFCDEIPISASIDEAVELAKRFGGEKSSGFINGILGAIARSNGTERPVITFIEDTDGETDPPESDASSD